ncbi:MAG TPA: hypothetical protein VEK11_11935 [Thermoanaerobaculia bacterium]|jgi:mono/diheme cytochrome c family protein|nr:hypothetical protein [Thermoanaerobaculia bacterium]
MKLLFATLLLAALPMPGTKFKELPPGQGKAEVEAACYACHASDLLAQQRLTEKQWTASVEKMVRWGANVPDKEVVVRYLARNFGPRSRFVATRVGTVK